METALAKEILGNNFIGINELNLIHLKMNLLSPLKIINKIPEIPFTKDLLNKCKETHFLFLAIPFFSDHSKVTINTLKAQFGVDPSISEPCFYNQDWYEKEVFANITFRLGWYLMSHKIIDNTRGLGLEAIKEQQHIITNVPSAVLSVYSFFLYYYHTGNNFLFKHDYIWNSDTDINGDRIYIGKYFDPLAINKNGIEIHRHLSIKSNYGAVSFFS